MLDYAIIAKSKHSGRSGLDETIAFLQVVSGISRVIVCLCGRYPHFIFPANPGPLADGSLTVASRKHYLDIFLAQAVAYMTAHIINSNVDEDEWCRLHSILESVIFCAAAVNMFMLLHVNKKWEV